MFLLVDTFLAPPPTPQFCCLTIFTNVFPLFPVDLTHYASDYFWPLWRRDPNHLILILHVCCQNLNGKRSFDLKTNTVGKLTDSSTAEKCPCAMSSFSQTLLWRISTFFKAVDQKGRMPFVCP